MTNLYPALTQSASTYVLRLRQSHPAAQKAYLDNPEKRVPTAPTGAATPLADTTVASSKKGNAQEARIEALGSESVKAPVKKTKTT